MNVYKIDTSVFESVLLQESVSYVKITIERTEIGIFWTILGMIFYTIESEFVINRSLIMWK